MMDTHAGIRLRGKQAGFTLIELLVAVAISAIVLLALGQFFISTTRTNTIQEKVAASQQEIRTVMEMITRDLRMAGLDPTKNADAGFTDNSDGTNDESIAFSFDYYNDDDDPYSDGDCDDDREHVSYSFDEDNGRIMYRWSNDGGVNWPGAQSLTQDNTVTSVEFEYFDDKDALDSDNAFSDPAANLDDIEIVRVTICGTITGAYSEDLNNQLCFSNVVRPRNL
ncbi:MAG: prepilin-type N-terminal cleavage/methylation domain-containing protein [Desulfobacteraceae bacterium]|nr:prepilin-type N-terminal cleavage/methylation domain-containing protein [Desulfobacteraceae bacterium]